MSVLTATAEPDADRPRVLLRVTGAGSAAQVQLVRVASDGSTTLVPSPVTLSTGAGTGYDYRVPFEERVSYRTVETSPAASGPVVLDVRVPWLIHPYAPSLSMAVPGSYDGGVHPNFVREAFRTRSRPSSTVEYEPLNRDDTIAVRVGRRRARTSEMSIRTYTLEQNTALDQLVEDDSPLLLNVPPSLRWGITYEWVQLGEVADSRLGIEGSHEVREWVLPFKRTGEPVGLVAPEWTFGQIQEAFTTFADIEAAYATFGDIELDNRRTAA